MDLTVIPPSNDEFFFTDHESARQIAKRKLRKLAKCLTANLHPRPRIDLVLHARVPIVKFQDPVTGYHVDISLSQMSGYNSNLLVDNYFAELPNLRPLLLILKLFLDNRNLNDPSVGGVGSFALILWLVVFLRLRKKFGEFIGEEFSDGDGELGRLLLEFFRVFGWFDFEKFAFCPGLPASYVSLTDDAFIRHIIVPDPPSPDVSTTTEQDIEQDSNDKRTKSTFPHKGIILQSDTAHDYVFVRPDYSPEEKPNNNKPKILILNPMLPDLPNAIRSFTKLRELTSHFRASCKELLECSDDYGTVLGKIVDVKDVEGFREAMVSRGQRVRASWYVDGNVNQSAVTGVSRQGSQRPQNSQSGSRAGEPSRVKSRESNKHPSQTRQPRPSQNNNRNGGSSNAGGGGGDERGGGIKKKSKQKPEHRKNQETPKRNTEKEKNSSSRRL
ncbi:hypothetical protein HK098_006573, partial [Nowakowskiella sp. JEL0407]